MIRRLLLCTDLDRTLLPNGEASESLMARECFRKLVERPEVVLAYVTGRHLELVDEAILTYSIPRADFAVTDVGTRIYRNAGSQWTPCPDWEEAIASDWLDLKRDDLQQLFFDLKELSLQEEEKLNHFKLSYYVPLDVPRDELLGGMGERLSRKSIRAALIWSVDEQAGIGLLDVIPSSATKLHAVEYVMEKTGFEVNETLFAGDSGNDLPVLVSRIPSVLVANASSEVRRMAELEAKLRGTSEALYIAHGGFHGMNGNYSAGILEGVAHFRPEIGDELSSQLPALP